LNKNLFLKTSLFCFFLLLQSSFVFSQDTVKVAESDTVSAVESKPGNFEDGFLEQAFQIFTSEPKIDSSDINNFIVRDFTDYLKVFRQLEILNYGPVSQAKYLRFLGIPSERVGIFYDDNSNSIQSLYIPQSGDIELQVLPFENIESVQLIGNSLANLIEPGGYSAGLFLKQKNYVSGEPFSKLQFDQGIKGYRRAQVELGRPLFQNKLRFYLTAGFKKYSGEADNTDQDLDNFTGKFTYDLNSNSKLVLNGSYYEGKRGVRGFPGWEVLGIRKNDKVSNWNLDYYKKLSSDKTFKLKFGYNYSFQNLKPMAWDLKNQTGRIKAELYPNSLSKFSWKIAADFKYDRMKEFERHTRWRGNFNLGTLWQIAPKLNHLAWVNFVKNQFFKADITAVTGFTSKPDSKWKIFVLGSRNIFYPTLFDLNFTKHEWPSYITISGDSNLLPLKSYSVNGGVSYSIGDFEIAGSAYYEKMVNGFFHWVSSLGYDTLWGPIFKSYPYSFYFGGLSYLPQSQRYKGINVSITNSFSSYLNFLFGVNFYSDFFYTGPDLNQSTGFLLIAYKHSLLKNLLHLTIISENEFIDKRTEYSLINKYFISNGKAGLKIKDFFIFYALENITNQTYRTFGDFNMPKRSNFWGVSWEFRD